MPFQLFLPLRAVEFKQRYFAELAFDGTNYHGWQKQHNALSVQEVFEKALQTLLRQPIETVGCGRTDTGVHARSLFVHFDGAVSDQLSAISECTATEDSKLIADCRKLTGSLNAILPKRYIGKKSIAGCCGGTCAV